MNTNLYNKRQSHLLERILPFLGVLAPYKVSVVPFTAIALFIVFVSKITNGKITISLKSKSFFLFFIYMIFRDILHIFFSNGATISSQINRLIEYVVLYVLIFFVVGKFNEDTLYKWWKIAGIIFGAGMLYHVIQIMIFNNSVTPISLIPGYVIREDALRGSMRPTSFFAEPAAYVTSMMPLLFLALKRKDLKWAFVSTFLILISSSTVGVILSAVLWILFVLIEKKSTRTRITMIFLICASVVLFLNFGVFSEALQKLELVLKGGSTLGSRVIAPFEVIGLMDWTQLLFGSNVLGVKEFILEDQTKLQPGSVSLLYAQSKDSVFLNTVASLIFRYGLLGLGLFWGCFRNKIFDKGSEVRMYAIMLLIAVMGQGNIATPDIPIILLVLYDCADNSNKISC